jgi:TetR/AcrR family transcriptional regulator, cholesterol catabolism regulator
MILAVVTPANEAQTASSASPRPRGRPRKTLGERDDGNRRQHLLQGAAKLFRRKGYGATTTRDIAAAVGMHSGSPFYHFKSKNALLYAVMEEGMRSALERQNHAVRQAQSGIQATIAPLAQMRLLVRAHFDVLLGAGNDFIPVMLYEARSLKPHQRSALARLQTDYEAAWAPVLEALHADGRLNAPLGLARLLIFGALNWSVQWFDRKKPASLDNLTDAAMGLFIQKKQELR